MEFKSFDEIKKLGKVQMQITQKIHGTNAQVFIFENRRVLENPSAKVTLEELQAKYPDKNLELNPFSDETSTLTEVFIDLLCGSRTRWIYPGDDNYGFAAFVHSHKEEFIKKLGLGKHFGEWAGPGINSGEGLTEKTFVLFDYWKFPKERPLPPGCVVVPVLYEGPLDLAAVEAVMLDLKNNGSKLAPGFLRPEGVVVQLMGTRYKKVFDAEETQWKKGDENHVAKKVANFVDYSHLCQHIRLDKLLSRDERYLVNFPQSLKQIASDYMDDLVKEGQITGSEGEINGIRKAASGQIFKFIRTFIDGLPQ